MNEYLNFAIETASQAGDKLYQLFQKAENKHRGTAKEIKSEFDLIADKIIKDQIERVFPTHSYLTEETGMIDKKSEYLWIIDPLDGTGNCVNKNPFFGVSIALWKNDYPILSVMEAPAVQERYVAVKDEGAYWINLKTNEEKKAIVSDISNLDKAYLVYCDGGHPDKNRTIENVKNLYPQTKDVRKLGSAVLELAWVGLGRAEAYFSPALSLWDIAAGILFVKEAGGKILNFELQEQSFEKMIDQEEISILATNGRINLPKIII